MSAVDLKARIDELTSVGEWGEETLALLTDLLAITPAVFEHIRLLRASLLGEEAAVGTLQENYLAGVLGRGEARSA